MTHSHRWVEKRAGRTSPGAMSVRGEDRSPLPTITIFYQVCRDCGAQSDELPFEESA